MEEKQPRVVANVEFTLRQCEAAGLEYRQWELCIDMHKT